jgi:hypothetical protein
MRWDKKFFNGKPIIGRTYKDGEKYITTNDETYRLYLKNALEDGRNGTFIRFHAKWREYWDGDEINSIQQEEIPISLQIAIDKRISLLNSIQKHPTPTDL